MVPVDTNVVVEMSTQSVLVVSEKQSSTIIDFLSLCGGFLGLFAGFSVLSAVEIVYFFLVVPSMNCCSKNSTKVLPFADDVQLNQNVFFCYINEVMQSSSIHSLNHIGNNEKNALER